MTRVGVIRDPANPSGSGQFGAIQAVAPYSRMEVSPVDVRDPREIERAVAALASAANGGLIVTANGSAVAHRDLIIATGRASQVARGLLQRLFVDGRRPDLLRR